MTLVELLIVVVILTTLVAAAIPLLAPTTSQRQLREASRGLNSFFQAAQARSVANGRPYGVALKRLSQDTGRNAVISSTNTVNDNGVAVEAFLVEQPSPYSGFDDSSAVQLAYDNGAVGGTGQVLVRFVRHVAPDPTPGANQLSAGWDPDLFPPGLLRRGDVIEVGGSRFMFTDDGGANPTEFFDINGYYLPGAGNPDGTLVTRPINNTGQVEAIKVVTDNEGYYLGGPRPASGFFRAPYWTAPMPYKVLRQPVPTSDEPYQLPEGTVVDLRASGIGDNDFFFWPATPPSEPIGKVDNGDGIIIMFTPEGRVSRVYYNQNPGCPTCHEETVVDNIYLLVGGNVPLPPAADMDPTLNTDSATWAMKTDEERQRLKQPMNWLRGDSVWLVLGSASGRIATIENAFVDPGALHQKFVIDGNPTTLSAGSESLRSQQILAAREFTREMSQLGGR
jgi:type II secretory pathway pseudopilin PulG